MIRHHRTIWQCIKRSQPHEWGNETGSRRARAPRTEKSCVVAEKKNYTFIFIRIDFFMGEPYNLSDSSLAQIWPLPSHRFSLRHHLVACNGNSYDWMSVLAFVVCLFLCNILRLFLLRTTTFSYYVVLFIRHEMR